MSRTEKRIRTPLDEAAVRGLRAGDSVRINGPLYTARDAAHQRLVALLDAGEPLPIQPRGQVIYYCGPAPTPPGRAMGSAGPTTSYRMDPFAAQLHAAGVRGTIGKGARGSEIREACKQHCAVYFVAIGGAGALLSEHVASAEIVAYEELGPEAIRLLVVDDFPVIVGYDCFGGSVFPEDAASEARV